jgi:hypothetical protein
MPSDAGVTRVHRITLSGRGSPEAILCGNFQLAPVASGNSDWSLATLLLPPQALRLPVATDTDKKPLYFKNCRLSNFISLELAVEQTAVDVSHGHTGAGCHALMRQTILHQTILLAYAKSSTQQQAKNQKD